MGYPYGTYYGQPYPSPIQQLQGENYHLREENGGFNEGTGFGALAGAAAGFVLTPGPLPLKAVGALVGLFGGGFLGDKVHDMQSTNHDAEDNGIVDGSPRYGIQSGYPGFPPYGGSPYGYQQYGYNQYGHA